MQLHVSLNIPDKDVESGDLEQDDIPTPIRFFSEGNRSGLTECLCLCIGLCPH